MSINHPFASIRALYGDLGSTSQVPISTDTSDFTVEKEKFVAVEYPVSTTEPTVNITKNVTTYEPIYVTNTTTVHHDPEKEANVAACVILSLLIVVFVVVGIWMAIRMSQEKAATEGYIGT